MPLYQSGAGQTVTAVFAINTYFDSAQSFGVNIGPQSGTNGGVVRVRFEACWMCSATYNGTVVSNNGTGVVEGIEFANCMMINNGQNGLCVNAGFDTNVIGGLYGGNTLSGIIFEPNVPSFAVIGARAGAYGGAGGNGQWGIVVAAGTSNDYIISLNRCYGNTSGTISDAGSGATKYVGNNIA